MHALHSMHEACTCFEDTKPYDMYVFGISAVNAVNWITFEKDPRTCLKRKYFFIQGSPFTKVRKSMFKDKIQLKMSKLFGEVGRVDNRSTCPNLFLSILCYYRVFHGNCQK